MAALSLHLLMGATRAGYAAETSAGVPAPANSAITTVHPETWPQVQDGVANDPAIDARAADLLSKMTVQEKVGQIIQADVGSVTPADVRTYHLGSILDGGKLGSRTATIARPLPDWLKEPPMNSATPQWISPAGHVAIPLIWGTDSVHGNCQS